jgi:hypothetical protein
MHLTDIYSSERDCSLHKFHLRLRLTTAKTYLSKHMQCLLRVLLWHCRDESLTDEVCMLTQACGLLQFCNGSVPICLCICLYCSTNAAAKPPANDQTECQQHGAQHRARLRNTTRSDRIHNELLHLHAWCLKLRTLHVCAGACQIFARVTPSKLQSALLSR